MTFQLRVYGLPVPQGRPRATVFAGRAHVYERKKDKTWKGVVKEQVIDKAAAVGGLPWQGALKLDLVFYLTRPGSLPRRVQHHVKRPDCDNLAKGVKDCLRGLVYKDDSQVVLLTVRKLYDERPGVDILAEFWEDGPLPDVGRKAKKRTRSFDAPVPGRPDAEEKDW